MEAYKKRKYQPQLRFSDFGGDHLLNYLMLFNIRRTENDRITLCNYFQKRSQKFGLLNKIPMYLNVNCSPMVLCLRPRFSKFIRFELSFYLFFCSIFPLDGNCCKLCFSGSFYRF